MYEMAPWGIPEGLLGDRFRNVPTPPELQPCEIHDVLSYGRCYLVKPVGMPRMPAVLGSLTSSMLPVGARDMSMLVPGSIVLCWISDKYYAVILSVLASPMGSSQMVWPDSIVAAGHAGLYADTAHNQAVSSKDTAHGFLDFSAGGPIDSLAGDWGHTNELGMSFFLGRLMASIRAGELCKFEFHYIDMLARLYAYNWQHYTAGSEDEAFDDEGEWTRIRGYSPFPWEAGGVNNKDMPLFDRKGTLSPKDSLDRMGIEPVDQLQCSFVRYKEFEGFLGDLRRRFVMMPVSDAMRRTYGRKKSDPVQYKGLFEEVLSMDGSYLLRSAKSIGLEKTIWIPVPEELYPRDNPKGNHDLVNSAGEGMDFAEYPDQGTPGGNVARLRDAQAYELNKRKSEPLNQRDKDWAIRDDVDAAKGAISTPGGFTEEIPILEPYDTFEQELPPNTEQEISPTGGRSSRYFQSKAFIGILEDGSILLRDGYGSEIRMVGGNIELSCPGDAIIRNGRTVQIWGGRDVIIKAQTNLEASASKGDVRIKAEHNLEVLGGNDGTGGVLIESRGSNPNNFRAPGNGAQIGGLTLKSSRGQLGMWANNVYMRSTAGAITMDSEGGDGDFVVYCGQLNKYLKFGSMELVAGDKNTTRLESISMLEHSVGILNFYGADATFGVNTVSVIPVRGTDTTASLTVAGALTAEGTVSGVGEYVPIAQPRPSGLNSIRNMAKVGMTEARTLMINSFTWDIVGASANGNKNVWGLIGFTFRASSECRLGDMVIYEAEWQKRLRQTAGIKSTAKYSAVWEEKAVPSRINPDTNEPDLSLVTMPFPGRVAWDFGAGAKYAQLDDQFYLTKVNKSDVSGGRPLPRGEKGAAYKLGTLPSVSEGPFKERYPVNNGG